MSLFNITYIRNLLFNNVKIVNSLNSFNSSPSYIIASNSKELKSNHLHGLLVKASKSPLLNIDGSINDFANQKLISPSFFTDLINQYWQETIFISKSSEVSEKYTNQLKSDGISIYRNQYKKLLFDFNKSLMTGRINTYLHDDKDIKTTNSDFTDIRYIWRKGFNLLLPLKQSLFSLRSHNRRHLNETQQNLIQRLKDYKVPIFTVTNNFNQIIVAEPSDELTYNRNLLDLIYQWYYNNILFQPDKRPSYESLFFINSADALEYKEYIRNRYLDYSIYNKQDTLNVFPSSLDVYYKLTNTSHPRVKFYLVPDLQELGQLMYKYKYYKNVRFHKQQKYGKNHFQGQPVYMIQPIYCKHKKSQQKELVEYVYNFKKTKKYQALFMNYEVALIAWHKFAEENLNYQLPNKPQIVVYNLEDILKMHETDDNQQKSDLVFIPNKESYNFIKSKYAQKDNLVEFISFSNQLLYFKTIAKRLIWSLTSRQPINLS